MFPWFIIISVISVIIQPYFCLSPEKVHSGAEVCRTSPCRDVGARFAGSMDLSVQPCDNFHKFACGQWPLLTPKPKFMRGKWNNLAQISLLAQTRLKDELQSEPGISDSQPVKLMKQFYKSCIDKIASERSAVARILKMLHDNGGWPMVMGASKWDENAKSWQSVEEYFFNIEGHSVFYSINLTPGTLSSLYTLTIQNSRTWPDMFRERKTYEKLMKSVAKAVIESINTDVSSEKLDEDIKDLIQFENQLYSTYQNSPAETVVDADNFISEFKTKTQSYQESRIDWETVFKRIYAITNVKPSLSSPLIIKPLKYFVELARIIRSTSKRTIVNFIHWKFLAGILTHATEKMEDLYYKILNNVQNVDRKAPRWIYCVNQIGRNYASYSLFLKKFYKEKSRQNADNLYRELLDSWKSQVDNSNWLSSSAKNGAKAKINDLSSILGYSNFYENDDKVNAYFDGLVMGDNYFTNNLNYGYHKWKRQIKFWGETPSSKEMLDDPLSLRARLDRHQNKFIVTPTFLQSPLLDDTVPNYVTYGTVGALMGHEMSHVLDQEVFRSLLSRDESRSYEDIIKCFIDSFDLHFNRIDTVNACHKNLKSRGEFTRHENIADWNGLQFAYQAYQKMKKNKHPSEEFKLPGLRDYTDDQMFFISFAQSWCSANTEDNPRDPHAPDHIRINGVVANTAEFAEAFKCREYTPMNPTNKCNIWTVSRNDTSMTG